MNRTRLGNSWVLLHPVNLDSNIGRGIIIYIPSSIDNCVIQINPGIKCEVCLLEILLYGEVIYPLVGFTEA